MDLSPGDHFIIQSGKQGREITVDSPIGEGELLRMTFTPEFRGVVWEVLAESGNMILAKGLGADDVQVKQPQLYIGRTMLIHKREFSLEPVDKHLAEALKKSSTQKIDNQYIALDDVKKVLNHRDEPERKLGL